MDDRRPACLLAAAAAAFAKSLSLLYWLTAPGPVVTLKAVLLHGAPFGQFAVSAVRETACALPGPLLAVGLAPYGLFWGALAAAAVWAALAVWSALPAAAARALAASALVCGLAISARASYEAAALGLSRARVAIAVATATKGAAFEFGRASAARELSKTELEAAKRALIRKPLLSPDRPTGPFDRVLKLGGGTASVTAAYSSRDGLERALVKAD
jgi:hypothetical protein